MSADQNDAKIYREETPEDIQKIVHKYCSEYLSDVWSTVKPDEIIIERLYGGLLNQVYRCALPQDKQPLYKHVPNQVAVRLYLKWTTDMFKKNRISDMVTSIFASVNNLAPKVYGVFDDGEVQEYVKGRNFTLEDQLNPNLMSLLARKVARFHSMQVPLKKDFLQDNWLFKNMDNLYKDSHSKFQIDHLINQFNLETFKNNNLMNEINWVKKTAVNSNSPIIFCHNDVRNSNILFREEDCDEDNKLVFCDFEWSAYGWRGFDLAHLFSEWQRNEFNIGIPLIPSDQQIQWFLNNYIEHFSKINGHQIYQDQRNDINYLMKETKTFMLIIYMYFILITMYVDPFKNRSKKSLMKGAEDIFKSYVKYKKIFIQQGIIQE